MRLRINHGPAKFVAVAPTAHRKTTATCER